MGLDQPFIGHAVNLTPSHSVSLKHSLEIGEIKWPFFDAGCLIRAEIFKMGVTKRVQRLRYAACADCYADRRMLGISRHAKGAEKRRCRC